MNEPRYIVIEGPIGVGKTTIAKALAEEWQARLVLEQAEQNPFLPQFYTDREKFAFQTQIAFMVQRFSQQQELRQQDLFQQSTISDYLFDKDRIFAYINLSETELKIYEQIYALLHSMVIRPDLVVFLQARTKVLLDRIKRRAREYERKIDPEYLERLNAAYNDFFYYYEGSPLLTVNTNDVDLIHNVEDLQSLVKEIRSMKKGKQLFNPLGSR